MEQNSWLAEHFEESRSHLKAVAYRMLGTRAEAEDAVQEVWIRLNRSDSEQIENLGGWLTTVVARICLDMLRSRKSRREEPIDQTAYELSPETEDDPEADLMMADAVGPALLVVLDHLNPAERIAFVLHDLFDLPFRDIAPIIGRTEEAARQLASRARRRVRGRVQGQVQGQLQGAAPQEDSTRQQEMVSAFLKASREGNFEALITLLHPDVALYADEAALKITAANKDKGAPQFEAEMSGAARLAETFKGRAAGAQVAIIDGAIGAAWGFDHKPVVAFCFTLEGDKISSIKVVMDQKRLSDMDIKMLGDNEGGTS